MSQQVTINGKKFLPSAILAKEFGYTLDYVSRLAREHKVEATRVGRVWFVEPESLSSFVTEAKQKKITAREQLSEKRREEHRAHVETESVSAVEVKNDSALPGLKPQFFKIGLAFSGSALVMVAGALLSVAISPEKVASLLDDKSRITEVPSEVINDFQAGAIFSGGSEATEKIAPAAEVSVQDSDTSQGLLVFDEHQEESDIERIQQQFSDEVEVRMDGESHGVITPVFKGRKGDDYQFLMVPLSNRDSS